MRVFINVAFLLLLASTISAQHKLDQGWESKPLDQWDSKDVKSIFESSAWGRLIEGETPLVHGVFGTRPLELKTNVTITLRSALPIRFALVRHRQLVEKYESMSADAKAEFNKRNKPLLDCPACQKYYVVSITGNSTLLRDKEGIMKKKTLIYLSKEKGEKRELENFSPQTGHGSEAIFFFPRENEKGESLLTAQNEKLTFNFKLSSREEIRVKFFEKVDFKVRDIVRDGKVIF